MNRIAMVVCLLFAAMAVGCATQKTHVPAAKVVAAKAVAAKAVRVPIMEAVKVVDHVVIYKDGKVVFPDGAQP